MSVPQFTLVPLTSGALRHSILECRLTTSASLPKQTKANIHSSPVSKMGKHYTELLNLRIIAETTYAYPN